MILCSGTKTTWLGKDGLAWHTCFDRQKHGLRCPDFQSKYQFLSSQTRGKLYQGLRKCPCISDLQKRKLPTLYSGDSAGFDTYSPCLAAKRCHHYKWESDEVTILVGRLLEFPNWPFLFQINRLYRPKIAYWPHMHPAIRSAVLFHSTVEQFVVRLEADSLKTAPDDYLA